MEKRTVIAVALAAMFVLGAVLVSAGLETRNAEPAGTKDIAEPADESGNVCGQGTCNNECGGSCGIPKCGCGG